MSGTYATPAESAAMQNDPLSPTVIIHKYLADQGLQPTSENIRRVLNANAANPGMIPGLVNTPAPEMPIDGDGTTINTSSASNRAAVPNTPSQSVSPSARPQTIPNAPVMPGSEFEGTNPTGENNSSMTDYVLPAIAAAIPALGYALKRIMFPNGLPIGVNPNIPVSESPSTPARPNVSVSESRASSNLQRLAGPEPQAHLTGPNAQERVTGPGPQKHLTGPNAIPLSDQSVIYLPDGSVASPPNEELVAGMREAMRQRIMNQSRGPLPTRLRVR